MPNGVSCSVANCSFWKEGNQCNASKIEIDIDSHANNHFGSEFAEEGFGGEHHDTAANKAATCCHTFKAKE
ncbi:MULTISPECIES: DUF1540 domain-containing protein [Paenibacillus]|uniref:DUF1540 domain-containing protein n=1 Tax=Paenibacillus lignilyticus TaxID=1172615 RepID=A0ABS5CE01_9BACL|nr:MULTISPECIES: DUF1540 domain-containing protein [Paenibacillus]MBP3964209.1 DUF1540 domain-containing protein [Paenibacillus lignilyticus]SFS85693.1 protein of unknown function [Paenibacillus sp. BC26]